MVYGLRSNRLMSSIRCSFSGRATDIAGTMMGGTVRAGIGAATVCITGWAGAGVRVGMAGVWAAMDTLNITAGARFTTVSSNIGKAVTLKDTEAVRFTTWAADTFKPVAEDRHRALPT